jgi:sugar phosphate isomerase/epimerase
MHDLKPLEPGVMFWAGRDRPEDIRALGVRCGQMCVPGELKLDAAAQAWNPGLTLVTVFAAYEGEDYTDLPTVARTVGFIPPETRAARERRTLEISDFAAALGVDGIACHIGCVPEDPTHPDYAAVRDVVRRVADYAARHSQTFALETGQEPARVLLRFMEDVNRPNLQINFDPANMILYGSGDPIEALRLLGPRVVSAHCKDGDWPPPGAAGALGRERPLGEGAVGIARYVRTLTEIGFRGPLNVERETEDPQERLRDLARGIALVRSLTSASAHTL